MFLDNDPYYWLVYAGEMVEQGHWRIRHTFIDNVPEGRPVHWSQSISWLLVLFGFVRKVFTGQDWPAALEDGAIWVNPALQWMLAAGGLWLLARRAGVWPAVVWLLGFLTLGDVAWTFHSLRPDHQSLHVLFGVSSVLFLSLGGLGWVRSDGGREVWAWWRELRPPCASTARKLMMASGIAGGLGLWTGASVQLLILGTVTVAALYLVLKMPVDSKGDACQPTLWRWWALSGAFTSLVMYAVEYAGCWPGIRLEVNSPLHAMSWACAGEILTTLARRRLSGGVPRGFYVRQALMILGALALPAALVAGPASWHALHDVEMKRLHNFILEFYTYTNFSGGVSFARFINQFGWFPALIPLALFLSGPAWSRTYEWGLLWLGFALAVAMGILGWQQIRWVPFFSVMLLCLLPVTLAVLSRSGAGGGYLRWLFVFLVVAQSFFFAVKQWSEATATWRNKNLVVEEFTKAVLTRNLALLFGARQPAGGARFLAEPDVAGPIYYFGRIPSVVSFYWENQAGLADAITFFSGTDETAARAIAKRRGLTHVFLPDDSGLAEQFYFMREGRFDHEAASSTLLARLLAGRRYGWIHPDRDLTQIGHVRYRFGSGGVNSSVTVFELNPDAP